MCVRWWMRLCLEHQNAMCPPHSSPNNTAKEQDFEGLRWERESARQGVEGCCTGFDISVHQRVATSSTWGRVFVTSHMALNL